VQDIIEFLEAGKIMKRKSGQAAAIDFSGVIEDFVSKTPEDFVVGPLRGTQKFVADPVGVNGPGAQRLKHVGDGGLARSHPARQTEIAAYLGHG
jgi:hypothetical protein